MLTKRHVGSGNEIVPRLLQFIIKRMRSSFVFGNNFFSFSHRGSKTFRLFPANLATSRNITRNNVSATMFPSLTRPLQQENLLMLTAVLLWCHHLRFKWWKDSGRRLAFGKETLHVYFAANPTGCQVHINRRHPFSDILKNFANKWSRTAAGKSKTSTMLPLLSLKCFHFIGSFPFSRGFAL